MNFFIMVKFLKVVFGRLSLPLEVMFGSRYKPLTGAADFCPFLPPLVPFLVLLTVALVGAARPPLATIPTLPRMKAATTTSLLEVCRVAMSSSSLVVFDCS
jgi:hypothetical protein